MTTTDRRPMRLLVADDDLLVRAGIVSILQTAPGLEVVAQADDGREAVEAALATSIDVALLDIQMPHLDGIHALHEIRRHLPDLPVAMLTTFSDEHLIDAAIREGALGFLLKSDEPQQLIAGVMALATGGGAFSPRVARWLAMRGRSSPSSTADRERLTELLTPRQLELLAHLGLGLSNAQIADAMHLSEGTVKQYVSAILDALAVDNRVHAAVLAYRAGLVDSSPNRRNQHQVQAGTGRIQRQHR